MRLLVLLALVGVAVCSDVLDLKDSDFQDTIKDMDIVLVEFFAPWCGHCKRLAPEYEKAATKLVKNDPPVPIAKVDCTAEKATCDKYGVQGFPTLKIFRHGEFSADYEGPREAEGIVKYMRGQVGPSSRELTSVADFDKFCANEEHAIIGFFEKETKLADGFKKVADTERDRYRFAHTSNADLIKKYGYTDDIVVFQPKILHNKFEENQLRYDGNYDTDRIKKFLETQLHGLCGIRTSDNNWQFAKPLVTAYYNVDYVKDPKGTNYWRNRVLKVAQDFKRKVNFAISNKNDFSSEIDEFGAGDKKSGDKPIITGTNAAGEKFFMEAEFSVDALRKFVEDLLNNKLEAYMKSEPIPESNDEGVKVLVAKNFKDIVSDDKDALLEFYAPWCGHCKTLAPKYDELGEKLKDEPGVVIAKMDATANDVPPQYTVKGFPTLYWKPKGGQPVAYSGGREADDLLNYVAEHATDELKGYTRKGKQKKKKTEL